MPEFNNVSDAIREILIYFRDGYMESIDVILRIIHMQRLPQDLHQIAYPAGPAPLVSISILGTEKAKIIGSDLVNDFNKNILMYLGERYTKKSWFFNDTQLYYDRYKEYRRIMKIFPESYKKEIESTLKTSSFYPYKGELRPQVYKKGILTEIEWIVKEIIDEQSSPNQLVDYYQGVIDHSIFVQGYPHVVDVDEPF